VVFDMVISLARTKGDGGRIRGIWNAVIDRALTRVRWQVAAGCCCTRSRRHHALGLVNFQLPQGVKP
jgi:hypothetical protein